MKLQPKLQSRFKVRTALFFTITFVTHRYTFDKQITVVDEPLSKGFQGPSGSCNSPLNIPTNGECRSSRKIEAQEEQEEVHSEAVGNAYDKILEMNCEELLKPMHSHSI